jgi:hypothetical protein
MMYPSDKPYFYTVALSYISIVCFVIFAMIEGYAGIPLKSYARLSLMGYCAIFKAMSTATKYAYQVFLNYKKKSTTGVAWQTMTVDLTASILALTQMQIDAYQAGYGFLLNDPRINTAKLLLVFFSGSFDIVILVQIFCIYPHSNKRKPTYKQPLLLPHDYTLN